MEFILAQQAALVENDARLEKRLRGALREYLRSLRLPNRDGGLTT